MGYGRIKTASEIEWKKKYGSMSEDEINERVGASLSEKLNSFRARETARQTEHEEKYNLPYHELVKALSKAEKQIRELEGKPESLLSTKRKELEAEYEDLVARGMSYVNKDLWINDKLVKYMSSLDGEYRTAKENLQQARKDYSIYLARKESWEQEHADIIEAERIRTAREELLQADPETLKSLGIAPETTERPYSKKSIAPSNDEPDLRGIEIDTDALFENWKIRNAGGEL